MVKLTKEDLGCLLRLKDGREGTWLGCMENDDELALRLPDGSVITAWNDEVHSVLT